MGHAVEIARCSSVEEALVLAGLLRSHDIPATVADYNMSTTYWMVTASNFGRVLVPGEMEAEAREIVLQAMADAHEVDDAEDPEDAPTERHDRYKGWFTLILETGPFALLTSLLVGAERHRRGEAVFGLSQKAERRNDKLFAPFKVTGDER